MKFLKYLFMKPKEDVKDRENPGYQDNQENRDITDNTDLPAGQGEQTGQMESTGQVELSQQTEQAEPTGQTEQTELTEQTGPENRLPDLSDPGVVAAIREALRIDEEIATAKEEGARAVRESLAEEHRRLTDGLPLHGGSSTHLPKTASIFDLARQA